jgi:hypothetical protein
VGGAPDGAEDKRGIGADFREQVGELVDARNRTADHGIEDQKHPLQRFRGERQRLGDDDERFAERIMHDAIGERRRNRERTLERAHAGIRPPGECGGFEFAGGHRRMLGDGGHCRRGPAERDMQQDQSPLGAIRGKEDLGEFACRRRRAGAGARRRRTDARTGGIGGDPRPQGRRRCGIGGQAQRHLAPGGRIGVVEQAERELGEVALLLRGVPRLLQIEIDQDLQEGTADAAILPLRHVGDALRVLGFGHDGGVQSKLRRSCAPHALGQGRTALRPGFLNSSALANR